ncbi:MerR family transcriptional regulator [Actinomadura sp. 7K507]|uniref:helix-turn-helix domain-containing protein n=1 Tax=Actinomadura sp. 7K507 TaxID=2530365 RepID=UPI001FB6EE76|nr:MerR family transcriptional regulator [Actinomadura sp. 7K507]
MEGTWTISELAERAAAALAADGSAQVSGRVRDLPNERLIRWYTTIGLVDPPLGRRGRTALYGPRHLLQLVAVKRRQATGRSIAEIQLELAAATDATLEQVAALPLPAPTPPTTQTSPPDAASTAASTASKPGAPGASTTGTNTDGAGTTETGIAGAGVPGPSATGTGADGSGADGSGAPGTGIAGAGAAGMDIAASAGAIDLSGTDHADVADRTGAHGAGAAEPSGPSDAGVGDESARTAFWSTRPDVSYSDVSYSEAAMADDYGKPDASAEARPSVVQGVRLTPDLTLLLDVPALDGDDLAAIETAARPLLDELRRRGLLSPAATSPAFLPADSSRRSQ